MKKYILRYLTENYFLDKSQLGNAGIYNIGDNRDDNPPVNAKNLIEEIVTLFGYTFTRTKWIIHDWCKKQKPDYCLKFYWSSHEFDGLMFPAVRRVMASTVGQDLVRVEPMGGPTGNLFYLDYQYGELHHPTPNYMLAVDPISDEPHITIAKVRNPNKNETIRKWLDSGLLDNFDSGKQSLADFYDGKSRQLLE